MITRMVFKTKDTLETFLWHLSARARWAYLVLSFGNIVFEVKCFFKLKSIYVRCCYFDKKHTHTHIHKYWFCCRNTNIYKVIMFSRTQDTNFNQQSTHIIIGFFRAFCGTKSLFMSDLLPTSFIHKSYTTFYRDTIYQQLTFKLNNNGL